MSSKVPFDLQPIQEERRDFASTSYHPGDYNYIENNPSFSAAPPDVPENLDIGK